MALRWFAGQIGVRHQLKISATGHCTLLHAWSCWKACLSRQAAARDSAHSRRSPLSLPMLAGRAASGLLRWMLLPRQDSRQPGTASGAASGQECAGICSCPGLKQPLFAQDRGGGHSQGLHVDQVPDVLRQVLELVDVERPAADGQQGISALEERMRMPAGRIMPRPGSMQSLVSRPGPRTGAPAW